MMGSDIPKKSMLQWGMEPQSLTFQTCVITTRPFILINESHNWPPDVTVGSDELKNSVLE